MRQWQMVVAFLGLLPGLAPAAPDMKEGLWEVTTLTELKGPPGMGPIPPTRLVEKQCLSRNHVVPGDGVQKECKVVKQTVSGSKVNWTTRCKYPDGAVVNQGYVTYRHDKFEGVLKMDMDGEEAPVQSTTRMTGRWLSACPKK